MALRRFQHDLFPGGAAIDRPEQYVYCASFFDFSLRIAVDGLKNLDYRLGDQYRAVTVSFDPEDTPAAARAKQGSTLGALGATDRAASWPFVVGSKATSEALADELGFRFVFDPASDQYAHPAALFILTPDGHIARYLYGVTFSPRDLRLGLLDASHGKVGGIVDRVLMTCYHFDPASRKYGPFMFGFMRLGALLILATVTALLAVLWRGERKTARRGARLAVNEFLRRILFLPPQASTVAADIDALHYFVILTTHRRRRSWSPSSADRSSSDTGDAATPRQHPHPRAGDIKGRTRRVLEVFSVSALAILFLAWWSIGVRQFARLRVAPANAMDIYVTAKQWMWKFAYPRRQPLDLRPLRARSAARSGSS